MVYRNPKFDLNKNPTSFSCDDEFNKDSYFNDTALRLECVGHGTVSRDKTRSRDAKSVFDSGCGLVLGLGPASSLNERDLVLKLGFSYYSSDSRSDVNMVSSNQSSSVEVSNGFGLDHDLDEGSTSAKSSGGYMPSLLLAPRISIPLQKLRVTEPEIVHDGTGFLVARDGGKRRVAPGFTKSMTGRGGLCVSHSSTVQERDVLVSGRGAGSPTKHSLSGSSAVSNSNNWLEKPAKRRQMIPPQVLVPSSMKSSSFLPFTGQSGSRTVHNGGRENVGLVVPEDRVHGGSLLSLLGGNLRDAVIDGVQLL